MIITSHGFVALAAISLYIAVWFYRNKFSRKIRNAAVSVLVGVWIVFSYALLAQIHFAKPLYQSIIADDTNSVIRILQKNDTRINERFFGDGTPLNVAVDHHSLRVAEVLLQHDAEPNTWTPGTALPPLITSAMINDVSMVRLLVKYGADPNIRAGRGMFTPLITASSRGYVQIVKVLLDSGADPFITGNIHKESALDCARERGDQEIVKLLEEAMA